MSRHIHPSIHTIHIYHPSHLHIHTQHTTNQHPTISTARFVRLGVDTVQLDKQGRARPALAALYSWRYKNLGNLDLVQTNPMYQLANAGLAHDFQLINVEDFQGYGETSPQPHFYQNLGEAEYVVRICVLFQARKRKRQERSHKNPMVKG